MNTQTLVRQQLHPPIATPTLGLVDRVALQFGSALVQWAARSATERSRRLARQADVAVRHHQLQSLRRQLDLDRSKAEASVLLLGRR